MTSAAAFIKKRYYKNRIRSNLFVIFLSIFIAVTLPSLLIVNSYNQVQNQQNLKSMADSNLALSYNNLDQTISSAKKISSSILGNETLQNFLKLSSPSQDEIILMENTLYNLCSASPLKLSAYLYDLRDNHYYFDSTGHKHLYESSVTKMPFYQTALALDGKTFCLNTSQIYADGSGLSVIRMIKDLNTLVNKGLLIINIPLESLNGSFILTEDKKSHGFILDDKYQNILSTFVDSSKISEIIRGNALFSDSLFCRIEEQELLLSYTLEPDWGLTIGTFYELPAKNTFTFNSILIVISLLNILFLWLGIWIASASLVRPITDLSRQMNTFCPKDFHPIHTPYEHSNEIGQLVAQYNEMGKEINQLLQKEIAAEKHRRHLELNLLQEQFKPHFLYNTIDHIRVLCLSGETQKANHLLQSMGTYYKTILGKGRSTISICDEVNTIRQYDNILSGEESSDYQIVYQVDSRLSNQKILKFVLQPLVENCIKHGLYGLDNGLITISFTLSDADCLTVSVADNGRGMSEDMVTEIIEQSYHCSSKSFGLAATLERLRLFYGEDCQIYIEDNHPGTRILFSIQHFSNYNTERSIHYE